MTALGQARDAFLEAKAEAERNPSGANLKALEEAQSLVDGLLDTMLETTHPGGTGGQTPVPPVSTPTLEDELLGE